MVYYRRRVAVAADWYGRGHRAMHRLSTPDLQSLAELALCHHAGCIEAGGHANRRGKHSAAICLVRQPVEALTIAEIGLQSPQFAEPLLMAWKDGKKSHGELRKALEQSVWPKYGTGLWDETWAEFYGNLARAVQRTLTTRQSFRVGSSQLRTTMAARNSPPHSASKRTTNFRQLESPSF